MGLSTQLDKGDKPSVKCARVSVCVTKRAALEALLNSAKQTHSAALT